MKGGFFWIVNGAEKAIKALPDKTDRKKARMLLYALSAIASRNLDGKHEGFEATTGEVMTEMETSPPVFREARDLLVETGILTVERPVGRAGSKPCVWHLNALDGAAIEDAPMERSTNILGRNRQESCPPHAGARQGEKKLNNSVPNGTGSGEPDVRLFAVPAPPPEADPITDVFEHWRTHVEGRAGNRLTPGRRAKVKARLKAGYEPEQIKAAIDFIAGSDFHNGGGQDGGIHNDLTLICRSDEKLDGYLASAAAAKARRDRPTVLPGGAPDTTGMSPRDRALAEKQARDDRADAAFARLGLA